MYIIFTTHPFFLEYLKQRCLWSINREKEYYFWCFNLSPSRETAPPPQISHFFQNYWNVFGQLIGPRNIIFHVLTFPLLTTDFPLFSQLLEHWLQKGEIWGGGGAEEVITWKIIFLGPIVSNGLYYISYVYAFMKLEIC